MAAGRWASTSSEQGGTKRREAPTGPPICVSPLIRFAAGTPTKHSVTPDPLGLAREVGKAFYLVRVVAMSAISRRWLT